MLHRKFMYSGHKAHLVRCSIADSSATKLRKACHEVPASDLTAVNESEVRGRGRLVGSTGGTIQSDCGRSPSAARSLLHRPVGSCTKRSIHFSGVKPPSLSRVIFVHGLAG